ncbi:unnamed protein product [Caretta caretta]
MDCARSKHMGTHLEQREGKEVAYWDYWKTIIDIIRKRIGSTEIKHVKAHAKQHTLEGYYRAKVDKMAKAAAATSVVHSDIKVVIQSQMKNEANPGKLQTNTDTADQKLLGHHKAFIRYEEQEWKLVGQRITGVEGEWEITKE